MLHLNVMRPSFAFIRNRRELFIFKYRVEAYFMFSTKVHKYLLFKFNNHILSGLLQLIGWRMLGTMVKHFF